MKNQKRFRGTFKFPAPSHPSETQNAKQVHLGKNFLGNYGVMKFVLNKLHYYGSIAGIFPCIIENTVHTMKSSLQIVNRQMCYVAEIRSINYYLRCNAFPCELCLFLGLYSYLLQNLIQCKLHPKVGLRELG